MPLAMLWEQKPWLGIQWRDTRRRISDSGHELVLDVLVSDVQDGRVEHGSLVVHLLDNQTVAEGKIFRRPRRVASEAPTLSPVVIMGTSLMISMVPLVILVGICRAWKKLVFSGPMPPM